MDKVAVVPSLNGKYIHIPLWYGFPVKPLWNMWWVILTCKYVCNASLLCSNTLLLNFIIFFGGNSGVLISFFN